MTSQRHDHKYAVKAPLSRPKGPNGPPTATFAGPMWQRHQRVLRLQRDHHGELNELGVRLLERAARATFDPYEDVRREGLCEPLRLRRG